MKAQTEKPVISSTGYMLETAAPNGMEQMLNLVQGEDLIAAFERIGDFKNLFQRTRSGLDELFSRMMLSSGKTSFLVFKCNKYFTIPVENIAFFYVRNESSMIMCFDRNEYPVNYSLEEIQGLISVQQFYRLNRQYLINFNAVREVEHYFARKLFVRAAVPVEDKLIVSKEKANSFLQWLENR